MPLSGEEPIAQRRERAAVETMRLTAIDWAMIEGIFAPMRRHGDMSANVGEASDACRTAAIGKPR